MRISVYSKKLKYNAVIHVSAEVDEEKYFPK